MPRLRMKKINGKMKKEEVCRKGGKTPFPRERAVLPSFGSSSFFCVCYFRWPNVSGWPSRLEGLRTLPFLFAPKYFYRFFFLKRHKES